MLFVPALVLPRDHELEILGRTGEQTHLFFVLSHLTFILMHLFQLIHDFGSAWRLGKPKPGLSGHAGLGCNVVGLSTRPVSFM